MNDRNTEDVLKALRRLKGFDGAGTHNSRVERLGGLTNRVYKVETAGRAVIVRIPGEGTGEYIDRDVEFHNAQIAAACGIAPNVLWADPSTGVMISEYIADIVTMTPEHFASRSGAPGRAGRALRALHDADRPFRFRFELFSMIDEYLKILSAKETALPEGYTSVVAEAAPVKALLEARPGRLVPSHCDPLCENFLDNGERMWIVDFEYSGMNDALWDLGDLAVEAGLTEPQEREMLTAYFGAPPSAAQLGRMTVYKAMCDLLWTLWGLIQHADGNPAEDFWAYATNRFDRCKALMFDAGFAAHMEAVAKG